MGLMVAELVLGAPGEKNAQFPRRSIDDAAFCEEQEDVRGSYGMPDAKSHVNHVRQPGNDLSPLSKN
jgi:hypothetical protein